MLEEPQSPCFIGSAPERQSLFLLGQNRRKARVLLHAHRSSAYIN